MNAELTTNTIEQDGFIIDAETGEILSLKEEFHVTDEKSADWVLEKIMDAEVEMAREDMKLRALTENIEARKLTHQRKAEFLKWKFGAELEAFAAKELEGSKTKTWKGTFGKLSFRTVKGGLRVTNPDDALFVAQSNGFTNAIKVTESFQISKLTDAQREMLEAKLPQGFEVKPDATGFKIETGVK